MLELVFFIALWSKANSEFIEVSNDQWNDGYEWNYVGINEASGTPAITIQPESGKEYIIFRLEE